MKEFLQLYQFSLNKFGLREYFRTKRNKLNGSVIKLQSEQILCFFVRDLLLKSGKSDRIAPYSPINGEVCTKLINSQIRKSNKSVFDPKIIGERMYFVTTNSLGNLSSVYLGIREPTGEKYIDIRDFDIFIVPAISIGFDGSRLGFDKGFYDKELENIPRKKIYFLVFDFQLINTEFGEEHDIKAKKVFTKKKLLQ